MKPSAAEILTGTIVALSVPAPPEAGGDYAASRFGMIATLLVLAAQEVEQAPAARLAENEAISALLAAAGETTPAPLSARASTLSALDARNAELRRALITLHERAETSGDRSLQAKILALYQDMAALRRLVLPG